MRKTSGSHAETGHVYGSYHRAVFVAFTHSKNWIRDSLSALGSLTAKIEIYYTCASGDRFT